MEEAINCSFQRSGVGAGIEIEIGKEGWLAQRCGDDTIAVAVSQAAECDEEDDLRQC